MDIAESITLVQIFFMLFGIGVVLLLILGLLIEKRDKKRDES